MKTGRLTSPPKAYQNVGHHSYYGSIHSNQKVALDVRPRGITSEVNAATMEDQDSTPRWILPGGALLVIFLLAATSPSAMKQTTQSTGFAASVQQQMDIPPPQPIDTTSTTNSTDNDDDDGMLLDLTKEILEMSLIAADLSALAYSPHEDLVRNDDSYSNKYPEFFRSFNDDPDQAIVAKSNTDGRCYLSFRGTESKANDWAQNLNPRSTNVYRDNDKESSNTNDFCESRAGYVDFLYTEPLDEGLAYLHECMATCQDENDCLVITGHSQGGAMATIASILLYQYHPTLVTFGQPPTVDANCPFIPKKYYRYVNSIEKNSNDVDFDMVAFLPTPISHSVQYGYFIMLGEDPNAVKFLGYDQDYDFTPGWFDQTATPHSMAGQDHSYKTKIETLLDNVPISIDGWADGNVCEPSYKQLCASGSCNNHNQCSTSSTMMNIRGGEKDSSTTTVDDSNAKHCWWKFCF